MHFTLFCGYNDPLQTKQMNEDKIILHEQKKHFLFVQIKNDITSLTSPCGLIQELVGQILNHFSFIISSFAISNILPFNKTDTANTKCMFIHDSYNLLKGCTCMSIQTNFTKETN